MAAVRYFIPEDGDTEAQPNVFLAPKPRHQGAAPTLGQIKQAFPIPGRYHFRFKAPLVPGGDRDKGQFAVWMDCVDDRQPVPTWQSTIVAKVTRVAIDDDDDFDDDEDFQRRPVPAETPSHPPARHPHHQPHVHHSVPPSSAGAPLDIFGGPTPTPQPNPLTASMPNLHTGGGGDLLGDFGGTGAAPASNGHHHNHHHNGGNADLLGMSAPPSGSPSYGQHHGQMPPQQQQQQQQQHQQPPPPQRAPSSLSHTSSGNSFDKFSQQNGPFGDLGQW